MESQNYFTRVTDSLLRLCLLPLALVVTVAYGASPTGARRAQKADADSDKAIGEVSWVIYDAATDKVEGQGTSTIRLSDFVHGLTPATKFLVKQIRLM